MGKLKDTGSVAKNIAKSIISGDILVRMKLHKGFPYILYLFVIGWLSIWISYKAEQTMAQVERNKRELEALKIYHAQKTCEYVSLDRISTVEEMLEQKQSEVTTPQKPADIIIKK